MTELHLIQPRYTCNACGTITKHRKRIQIFKVTGDLKPFCKNGLDKTFFTHNGAHSNGNDLAKRTISGKILKDKVYEVAINPKYDSYQRGLASMMYKIVDKKIGSGASVNEELAQELYKLLIKKFKRRKTCARFKDITWPADLAENFFLTKHTWSKPIEDRIGKTVLHGFFKIVEESKRQPYSYGLIKEENFF